jgi:hypothetical protein
MSHSFNAKVRRPRRWFCRASTGRLQGQLSIPSWIKVFLLLLLPAVMTLAPRATVADESVTAKEFLAQCDRLDPVCHSEFVAGLQAVYVGGLSCPPRIDVNTPIMPWLDYMRRRIAESPSLADGEKNSLQLEAFMRLWPCPKK